MLTEFKNEQLTDFTVEKNAKEMKEALRNVKEQLGREYPIVIAGDRINTVKKIISLNPSDYKEAVGYAASADIELAEKAIESADLAFRNWKNVKAEERANYLFHAAAIMRRRKYEFSAWLVMEAGKNWSEADGDTAEAIDFLEYYGRRMVAMAGGVAVTAMEGENNECFHIPLGIGVIISPWNFPLAILTGMAAAAIVTGNTIIMKPASSTPIIASKLMEVWEDIGLPEGVVNYLPCSGGVVGDFLVSHPKTRFINFTGSKEIGLRINSLSADTANKPRWIKRVVAEMGGKNAIIVDSAADIEAAAEGIVAAAFGFQGQKCSACSRAIIVQDVYDEMIQAIEKKTKELTVGNAGTERIDMGPVVDEKAFNKIMEYIEIGKSEGRIIAGGLKAGDGGYFIAPTVIVDVDRNARISQEEIFGPVLAVIKAKNFQDALDIANDTEYGLTGSVYSMNREVIEKAKKEFHIGNLYLNRKCTGALVGINPFGGFNMSGTDSKAGGPEYLNMFMQLKSVTERY